MKETQRFNYGSEKPCQRPHGGTFLSRFLMAMLFIAAGGLLVANQLDYISPEWFNKLFNWQMLLIGIGLVSLTKRQGAFGGIIMLLIGFVFILPLYINMPVNSQKLLWPAVLIGVGLVILFNGLGRFSARMRMKFNRTDVNDVDTLDGNHIFGGGDHVVTTDNFKGGQINAVFGGGKYDLSRCKLAPGTNILNVSLIFGGIELIVPSNWVVKVEADSILGGFSNKSGNVSSAPATDGTLIIKGTAIFGGAEIKRI